MKAQSHNEVAKVMFLQASVCPQVGEGWGCLPQCMPAYHPPEQTLPGADTPASRCPQEQTPPLEQTPPKQTPPRSRHPPPGADPPQADTPEADTPRADTPPTPGSRHTPTPRRYGHCCGRYASYCNVFLCHCYINLF